MNSQTRKWNAEAAKAQVKERQDQVAAAIKKVGKAKHTPGPWTATVGGDCCTTGADSCGGVDSDSGPLGSMGTNNEGERS